MNLKIVDMTGDELTQHLNDVARLRLKVFADFPYLYDGTLEYEQWYLEKFAAIDGAIVVACFDGEEIVGVATGSPMAGQMSEFSSPLEQAGYDCAEIFYCGESVLLSDYRGHGIGHEFFNHREAQAQKLGLKKSCFLSVKREADHLLRPSGYSPLDPFWRKRGYEPLENVTAHFLWKEHSEPAELDHELQYWMRDLT